MSTFKVSQGELWHRVYLIEANTLENAKKIYDQYLIGGIEAENITNIREPEYIEDIDDVSWFDEQGGLLE